uniref:Transferrin-binding protein B C-lobe/N-lobe beta-barrel domain-containing protein n=1 Tax=Psychrobacter sp. (strain PRwf-1) TaxID=349106 RepID=A5WGU1_PSYWF
MAKEKVAQEAIAAAEAKQKAAQDIIDAAQNAKDNAQINNAPESAKSGVQTLNVDVVPLGKVFKTTTRDFEADSTSVVARADLASESAPGAGDGLLGQVPVTISGDNDADIAGTNGFKAHEDTAEVDALGNKLPLTYTSTYKDFGDDMRIGHIDGKAVFSGLELPVNGAAVIGNATKAENMPTEGTVGYTGDATHRKLGLGNAIEFGSSVFTADFVKKALDGKLSFAKAGDINLKANISGNKFSGGAADNAGYATEGGFYGGDAQYLGGVYEGNGAQGTYGAKSDKQTAAEQAAVDAQAAADAVQKEIEALKVEAEKAKADAVQAKAAADKAQAEADKAKEKAENAGGSDALKDALAEAEAADKARQAAEAAKAAAELAASKAEAAKKAAENALAAEKSAAEKAVGEAKAEADKRVEAAEKQLADAKAAAAKAKADADKAKADADIAVQDAKDRADKAEAEAVKAKADADAANNLAASEKAKAEAAQKEAETAKSELAQAQKDLEAAEQALADALANGGGNTEALQAEVDRRQAALDAANDKAAAAEQASSEAIAAAEAQIAAANQAAKDAQDALAAAQIKNAPESAKSGVQTLNVDVVPLGKVFKTTTRDFEADSTSVVARADLASESAPGAGDGLLGQVPVTISGDNDADIAGTNGFKAHEDNAIVGALGQELPLTYTSTYKDFGDDMRIGHIDGKAVFSGLELPVNGAAVIGNATKAENMPTEGTVGYTGDATHRKLGLGNAIEFGSSVFTADFVKKALDGKLSFAKAGDINLKANISGNKFSGGAADNAGYATEGGFYGGDAQYLGGVYEGNGAQGTYGAKSDKQTAAEQAAVDAQAAADAAQAAIATEQAKAQAAQAAAEKAKADAAKAQAALEKAQDALANAGSGEDLLAAALERADAAEKAQEAAEAAEAAAKTAAETAKAAENAAKEALVAAQAAADKAIGDAKAEAQKQVDAAKAAEAAAKQEAVTAQAAADKAKADAEKAKTDAGVLVAEANKQKEQAEAEAVKAKADADAANNLAASEKAKAEAAQKEAETAKSELAQAQKDLEAAEQALADALASGGGNTEALQAEVDRRQAALEAANGKAAAAEQASSKAIAAAEAQIAAANQAAKDAQDALAAAQIKNAPESAKSGVQTLNVDVVPLGKVFKTTTRDFDADGTSVIARADLASQDPTTPDTPGLLGQVPVTISGDNDQDVAGTNGFKSHEDSAVVGALGQELPLTYTSTYKDFGDEMRIGHIDGKAVFSGLELPVNGAAVIGNATKAENMPTEGTVGYTGDATHRKLGLGNAIEFGSSVFTADFVKKALDGKLSFAKAGDINLKANISGNKFSGGAADNAGYATEGGFYGGDAQYLGGVYEGNGAQGTYGAKSDKQTAAEQAAVDAQAAADAAQAAIATEQAKAQAAQAAAEKAKADAAKAQAALEKAQDALANAGSGGDGGLADALARVEAAEAAQAAAEDLAAKAQAAQKAAEEAKAAAESAQAAAQAAADKAVGEAKAKAEQLVAEAKAEAEAANEAAKIAKADADAANVAAEKAKTDAGVLVAEANKQKEQAEAEAVKAKADADAANNLAASEKAKAEAAQKEAETAKSELAQAQKDLEAAEQALADALASGGGNTEALQAEVDRRQAALEAANGKAAAAEQASSKAIAAAEAQIAAANQAAKDAQDALAAAQIKNAPESAKSGVQTLNVDVVPLGKVFKTTTRDFDADSSSVVARADLASQDPATPDKPGLLGQVPVTISGDNDADIAGTNGFKAHEDSAIVEALGQELPLTYTSTYKDFGDDMRIGHIDGKAVFSGLELPVNGAAVIGNATKAENMPTEGTVGYTGDATHRKLGLGNAIEFGSSVFTADFVKKALDGKLSFAKAGDINLKANISGNKFSGGAADNAGYATEGGFYGGDAQYLGGVYEGNGAQGTYGAKSDKQTAAEQAAVDAQAAADAAQAAIATEQAKAQAAQAAAEKAKADAAKAQAALEKAQDALANAGSGEDLLAAALERADAAEKAQEAAEAAEAAAKTAAETAKAAENAAKEALVAAQAAADKAIGDAKAEAQKQVDAAKAAEAAAKQEAVTAQAAADKAKADADKAKADADIAVQDAKDRADKAEAEAVKAQQDAVKAKQDAETAQQQANDAKTAAAEAEQKLKAAQDKIKQLQDELENSGPGGNVNVEELKEQLKAAQEDKVILESELQTAKDAEDNAKAAAEAQIAAANQAAKDAQDALAAAQIKNAPESAKSGVQTLNVDVVPLGKVFKTTTRDFDADSSSVVARADLASQDPATPDKPGLLGQVPVTISGDNDADIAGTNGFKAHEDSAIVEALGQELPLTYTSTYKDFGDEMRIGHIDGKAVFTGLELPVNGAAVIGNATKAENMPTEGTVGYTGDATHRKLGLGNAIEFGSSLFTADFVKKALDGKLSFAKAGDINLKANISGNKFSGGAADNAGYATEGGFYGGDAQYLGGVYEGNGAQGTYGAKSDKQTAAEKAAADAQAAAAAAQAEADKANTAAQAAQKAAQDAQAQLADKQAEIERLQRRIENAGSGNGDALQQLQDELDAAIEAANQAKQQKDDALEQLTAAQTNITELQATVDGLKGDNTQLQEDLAQAKKNLQAQIDSLKADNEDLQAQADALQEELDKLKPDAPENIEYAVDNKITGVQSNKISGYKGKDGALKADSQGSYETLTIKAQDLDTDYVRGEFKVILKDNEKDKAYISADGKKVEGFKVYSNGEAKVPGTTTGDAINTSRTLTYTSVYNKFADMQIGHVYGNIPSTAPAQDGKLSTVYAQGNATAAEDMKYMQELAKHNLQQGLQNGEGVDSGKVGYAGVSTYQKNDDYSGLVVGTSEFDVDFVNQQVDGTLAFKGTDIDNKKIKAEINGNKFSGNWNGLDTQGGFFGQDAAELGGIYKDAGGKGTYGAGKGKELPGSTEADITGFQSTALSSVAKNVEIANVVLDDAIGYVEIRNDKSNWSGNQADLVNKDDSLIPVDTKDGNNFTGFDKLSVRADMVKPESVQKPLEVSLGKSGSTGSVTVEAGKGSLNPNFNYKSVYKDFDAQMQVGHVYGVINSGFVGDLSRVANVYAQGYATTEEAMADLAKVNEGKANYTGNATYIENIHLGNGAGFEPVNGTSNFNVDFVNKSVKGELAFDGDFKYMPEGNKIGIEAAINGNTFAGNVNGIDTAGGFYGDDAQFLGGIYQDASVTGGKGDLPGTGTRFQGTFGAEKQPVK